MLGQMHGEIAEKGAEHISGLSSRLSGTCHQIVTGWQCYQKMKLSSDCELRTRLKFHCSKSCAMRSVSREYGLLVSAKQELHR